MFGRLFQNSRLRPAVLAASTALLLLLMVAWPEHGSRRTQSAASGVTRAIDHAPQNPEKHDQGVSFSRQVLPILSDRCFHCHGPDQDSKEAKLAGFRLDLREEALGLEMIMPGDPANSPVWERITSDNPRQLMPPPDSHRKPLTEGERDIIKGWIEGGAQWGKHWSFEKLQRPIVPDPKKHPVDAFVDERLQQAGMKRSDPADPVTLLRRLSFDLTGMAPTPEQVAAVRAKPDDPAVLTSIVEDLFTSPHHAERMAMWWLDAARYSDSDGFQQDADRQNWPWRDWVIQQFAQNRPYDQFTTEQFAGELLSNATDQTRLATAFHRHHMTNGEGGRDPEESRIDYVIDRINTTGTVWMGLTLGCVQCHTHKFDPITHQDYYTLFAFFNSIDEDGKAGMNAKPYLKFTSPKVADLITEQQAFLDRCQQQVQAERKEAGERFELWLKAFRASPPTDYKLWHVLEPKVSSVEGTEFVVEPGGMVQTKGAMPYGPTSN